MRMQTSVLFCPKRNKIQKRQDLRESLRLAIRTKYADFLKTAKDFSNMPLFLKGKILHTSLCIPQPF